MTSTLIDERSDSGEPGVVSLPATRPQQAAGDVLDRRYRLRVRLGRGGFGDVWRAEELLPDGAPFREVALKLLVSTFADAADWADEAKLLASFRHPSLVTIYAAGILNEAPRSPFVSMELLEGCNLADLGRHRGPIPWRRVLAWARDVAGALDVIHAGGVVHLDLKPANLFLAQDGALKVLDFGISRRAGPGALSSGPFSRRPAASRPPVSADLGTAAFLAEHDVYAATRRAGFNAEQRASDPAAARSVIGTPGFMAPEVFEMAEPTAAADAYALAVCLVQLATGRLPHDVPPEPPDGDAPGVTAWWAELRRTTLCGIMRDLGRDPARLPRGLLALLTRLLSVDPAHRRVTPGQLKPMLDDVWERPHGVPEPPYPGLTAFSPAAEGLLFGRDEDVARLGRELLFEPCVVLQGPRGSGKTSLASAGLVPHLARRHADQKDDWIEARVDPGDDPDGALSRALASVAPELEHADLDGLAAWCMTSSIGVVLVVDPLERLGSGRLAALVSACAAGETRRGLRWIGVLSEEKTPALLATPQGAGLRAALRYVGLPSAAAVRDIVAGPAELAGAEVRGLAPVAAEVQRELRSGGEGLTFVALALAAWWEARTFEDAEGAGRSETRSAPADARASQASQSGARASVPGRRRAILSGEAWTALGGVHGALARHADTTLAALDPPARALAEDVLLRLGAMDETRVRWAEDELAEVAGDAHQVAPIFDALERAHLLVRREGAVELSHEALLSSWPHLRAARLLNVDRLILFERLREAAEAWDRAGEHPDFLVRGELLEQATGGAGERQRLPRRERALVDESARRARWKRVARICGGAAIGLGIALGFTLKNVIEARQTEADEARRAAEERADLAEVVGKSRRTEDPFHRAAWIAEAMARGAPDGMLPLDLATAALGLPHARFLTLDPATGPAVPWGDRWVIAGGPGGTMIVADLNPPEAFEGVVPEAETLAMPRERWARVLLLRPHEGPVVERVPFAFDTAVVTRSVSGEVRVLRLRQGGTVALAAVAPMRCGGAVQVAEAAPVVACATDAGIARWDLRRGGVVDTHPFRGNVLGVSPDGARIAALLGHRALLWEPASGAGPAREAEVVLPAPAVLGRWSPRDPVIAFVQQGRTSLYAIDRPEAPLLVLATEGAPVSARWDAGGLDLGICGAGSAAWHYLRSGGRAADDPAPEGSPCGARSPEKPQPVSSREEAGVPGHLDLGPHPIAGGWKLPDGRVLTRDLVLFDVVRSPAFVASAGSSGAAPPAQVLLTERLLRFTGHDRTGGEEPHDPHASTAAVLRSEDTVAWQIGGEVRLYGTGQGRRLGGREVGGQKGNLLRRCDDGRILAWRAVGQTWSLFDARTGETAASVPRAPAFVLGVDAACRTLLTQELDGNVIATSLLDLSSRTIAVTDGYIYDVRPSAARGGVGPGLWLAFSSGAVARVDDGRGEVRVLGYATPRATGLADGPEPGDVAFADATGIVVMHGSGVAEQVLEGASGAEWEDLATAPDGKTMLLASSERLAVLDLERHELIGSMPSDGRERLAPWDAEGSVLVWSFGRVGGVEGIVVPRGVTLAKRVAEAVSNLRVQQKRLVARQ